ERERERERERMLLHLEILLAEVGLDWRWVGRWGQRNQELPLELNKVKGQVSSDREGCDWLTEPPVKSRPHLTYAIIQTHTHTHTHTPTHTHTCAHFHEGLDIHRITSYYC